MNLSAPFIRRPIGTLLLTIGIALVGIAAFFILPVAPLPQVDYPTIRVQANLAGASPQTMASSVATPLERRLGVIPGVTEMTSDSGTGSTRITLQFDLNRSIDGAAREVQAAISAARADLPATLRQNPTYNKVDPSASPVIQIALTSNTMSPGQIYDAVSNIVQQRLAQLPGVGEVEIGGGSLPAVRVTVNPYQLNRLGIPLEDVRAAIQAANANRPKGALESPSGLRYQIYTDTVGRRAADYARLTIAWRNGAAVRLSDIATVTNSVSNTRTLGLFNGRPAIIVLVTQQPGANLIRLVDAVRAELPALKEQLPADIDMAVASDRTSSIRAALGEIEITVVVAIILVVLVVSAFLRSARATAIPAIATIVSLLGTFGVMYLLGFSLNNLSLMAITVATGFVVDDAIVVLENTSRHLEAGMERMRAAMLGAREVGFTVLSISISLVAVFIPLLFMGGQTGRLFREFAVTLSVAVMISLVLSLTTTPMLCAWLLKRDPEHKEGRIGRAFERGYGFVFRGYATSLDWALAMKPLVIFILVAAMAMSAWLYVAIPKGFFPQQDNPLLFAGVRADQSVSFQAMSGKLRRVVGIMRRDPAVATVSGFTGGSRSGGAFLSVMLKPLGAERREPARAVIARLQPRLEGVQGLRVFLFPYQDIRSGGRQSNGAYSYTLTADSGVDLWASARRLVEALKGARALTDVDANIDQNGVESFVSIDRDTATRVGITPRAVDNALYNAFGQRAVGTIYEDINQYDVILEWDQRAAPGPSALDDVYVPADAQTAAPADSTAAVAGTATLTAGATSTVNDGSTATQTGAGASSAQVVNPALRDPSTGSALSQTPRTMVPLSAIASFGTRSTESSVEHQNGELSTTISFNLADGATFAQARTQVEDAVSSIALPGNVRGSFTGTAQQAQSQQGEQPLLILGAIVVIYLVLGMLYESLIHPITVLSTLPAAGVGAVLALLLFGMEFSIIALIGVFLLLGIVKKNAILVIDFALDAQRNRGLSSEEAAREACLLRFRPILMTTLAAMLGALPLAIGFGEGAELRRPLGVTIIGGLIAAQLLTLITTPVVYIYLDRLSRWRPLRRRRARAAVAEPVPA